VRVLVTGVSGFAGSFIAEHLAANGHDVTGLYRRGLGFAERLTGQDGLTLAQGDLTAPAGLSGPYEAVVHTAATSPAPGIDDAAVLRDGRDATQALLARMRAWNSRKLVFLSSLSLHGEIDSPLVDEMTPIIRPDAYGVSKADAERMIADEAGRLSAVALRLPGVIGPGAHRNWLSGVAAKLRAGQPVRAFSLDAPFNNACHVADLARLTQNLMLRDWTGFDAMVLGARGAMPVRGIIETLAEAMAVACRIEEAPVAKSGFLLSSERAMARWGYDPMEIGTMIARYGRESSA
jgi:nucleoside-diphosphate-sugar epimerase